MEFHYSELPGIPPRRTSVRVERQYQIALPFRRLSMSNLPPTESELSEIQNTVLPALDEDILAVNSELSEARLRVNALERERDALGHIEYNFDKIISTRRRIPPEIWSEIFLYGDLLDSSTKDKFNWPSRTIWQLSQVCQTWRNLAFSLHLCWSFIVLNFSSHWPAPEKDVELLSFVLERSHQHLLDITLVDHGSENLPLPLCHMRDKVFAESHRWRSARLVDYHEVRPDVLYAPLRGRLPHLKRLKFESELRGMNSDRSDHSVISAFKDCPRLVTVGLIGADPRIIELPVEQITSLRLCDQARPGYFTAFVDLLSQCPLLETLRVELLHEAEQDSLVQISTLPSLRDLSATYPDLLHSLTLPQLQVATLDQRFDFPDPDTLYAFHCLIGRSNCAGNLTELRLIQVPLTLHHSEPHLLLSVLSQTTALAMLQLVASITDFRLDSIDEWSQTQVTDVMKALEVVAGQGVAFLPRLVSLDIDVAGHTDINCIPYLEPHDDFIGMLKARHEVGLGRFHFGVRADYFTILPENGSEIVFDDEEISVLRGLVDDGMALDICFDGVLVAGL